VPKLHQGNNFVIGSENLLLKFCIYILKIILSTETRNKMNSNKSMLNILKISNKEKYNYVERIRRTRGKTVFNKEDDITKIILRIWHSVEKITDYLKKKRKSLNV